jgi:N-dimethylarginine dimethylaminohydrolase
MVTDKTLAEFNFSRPVDRERFLSDYDTMLGLFQAHGVETLLLTDVLKEDDDALGYMARRPNMTYSRDLAVVFSRGAVLMSPHLKGRWGDQLMMARRSRLGIPILGAVEPPATSRAGSHDLGDDTAVASLCDRANETGTRMPDLVLARTKYFPRSRFRSPIHIDGIFMVLDRELALIIPIRPRLSLPSLRGRQAGRPPRDVRGVPGRRASVPSPSPPERKAGIQPGGDEAFGDCRGSPRR